MATNLYGIDILIDQNEQMFLGEINGQNSGINGFHALYGDNRVTQKVIHTLEEHAGKITVNNGKYAMMQYVETHPIKAYFMLQIGRVIPSLPRILSRIKRHLARRAVQRRYALNGYVDWIGQSVPFSQDHPLDLEEYIGQESTVLNHTGEHLPHPTVNSPEAEVIADNKLLQYVLLRESSIKDHLIPTIAAAMGTEDSQEIDSLLETSNQFVMKPTLGLCGLGVKKIAGEDLARRKNLTGFYRKLGLSDIALARMHEYVPASVAEAIKVFNYQFELGLAVIQPFINTQREGLHRSIRAIVCCNKFIDAYERVSASPVVNLSQGAQVQKVHYDGLLNGLPELCERIVRTYEEEVQHLVGKKVKDILYQHWLESRPSAHYSSEVAVLLPYLRAFQQWDN